MGSHVSHPVSSLRTPNHLVQLFDAPRSLADAVSRFLLEGWERGDDLLLIVKPKHWQLIAEYLERRGWPAHTPEAAARLHMYDAAATLRRTRKRGAFSPDAAREVFAAIAGGLSACAPRVRAYGELVELLAEEGDFEAACAVEDMWNDLLATHEVDMLCGYSAAHFADPRHANALRRICARHTHVQTQSADSLGTWLSNSLG